MNKQQNRVVFHQGGPLLVLACPGSGKTRCIVERITHLIDEDVPARKILAVTFTNKAATEMAERVREKGYGHKLLICTFHSLCVRILRQCCHLLGYKKNFSICDDPERLIRKITRARGHDPQKDEFAPKRMLKILEDKYNQLLDVDVFEEGIKEEYLGIIRDYEKTLKTSNSFDFGGLIYYTAQLFKNFPKIRAAYASRWTHVLVDEMQDTNVAQLELVKAITSKYKNVIVVGDADQCFPAGTLINTPKGKIPIEDVKNGDEVCSLIKPGEIGTSIVSKCLSSSKSVLMVTLKFEDGTSLECTHNHIIPMSVQIDDQYFVYLMYKRNLGFRIGCCDSNRQGSFRGRLAQEHGDAIWIIDTAESKSNAVIKEQYWSIKYGIPTIVFHTIGRKVIYEDSQIKWLHENAGSYKNGMLLLKKLGYSFNVPHHYPRMGASVRDRYTINVSLCADRGLHRYSICTDNYELLSKLGSPRKSKFKNWRIENSTKDLSHVHDFIQKAKELRPDTNVYLSIKGDNGKPFQCQPAANAFPGTIVYCSNDHNEIIKKKTVSVETCYKSCAVYDLNIDRTHNYFANNVMVHNSIYGWRGACISNILNFQDHFPEAEVTHLSTNYRSTPEILGVAEKLINKNKNRQMIPLTAHRCSGELPQVLEHETPEIEAEEIANLINSHKFDGIPYKEMVVLCRVNALTRTFEECFRRREIPYVLIGSFGFYDRAEVKTGVSYMKFLSNPEDIISFEEIINTPSRGVGPVTVVKIMEHAIEKGVPFLDVCRNPSDLKGVTKKAKTALTNFVSIIDKYDPEDPSYSLNVIFEDTGFLPHLKKKDKQKGEHREDNVLELLRAFDNYCTRKKKPSLDQYLQEIMLLTSADKETSDDAVRLMTAHAAKGLEFDVVFIPGMIEDIFPHKRSVKEGNVAEERRVCYVACTRARYHLYLSRAGVKMEDGKMIGTMPSRFLEDMGLIEIDWDEGFVVPE